MRETGVLVAFKLLAISKRVQYHMNLIGVPTPPPKDGFIAFLPKSTANRVAVP